MRATKIPAPFISGVAPLRHTNIGYLSVLGSNIFVAGASRAHTFAVRHFPWKYLGSSPMKTSGPDKTCIDYFQGVCVSQAGLSNLFGLRVRDRLCLAVVKDG